MGGDSDWSLIVLSFFCDFESIPVPLSFLHSGNRDYVHGGQKTTGLAADCQQAMIDHGYDLKAWAETFGHSILPLGFCKLFTFFFRRMVFVQHDGCHCLSG